MSAVSFVVRDDPEQESFDGFVIIVAEGCTCSFVRSAHSLFHGFVRCSFGFLSAELDTSVAY